MQTTNFSFRHMAALGYSAAVFGFSSLAMSQIPLAPAATAIAPPSAMVPAAMPVDRVLAQIAAHPRENLEVTYTVYGSAPWESKSTGQHLRLVVDESGMRDVTLDDGTVSRRQGSASRSITINTGKHKTVSQLSASVAGYFQHFLQGPLVSNQDLGKIGDAKFGGELHFIAESPGVLRFDFLPVTAASDKPIRFSQADVTGILGILRK